MKNVVRFRKVLAPLILCVATASGSLAQTFDTLFDFNGTDGSVPYHMSFVRGFDGSLYGTTLTGGVDGNGTIFKIGPQGFTTLYTFCSKPSCDGYFPSTGLTLGITGYFYGTTGQGGAHGNGTIFKITQRGTLTTLYGFCVLKNCSDGSLPVGHLAQDAEGNLYGTTNAGGNGWGTVFKLSLAGKLTTLYSFCSQPQCIDGSFPLFGLIQATDGNFYGTTYAGGAYDKGTVFKITPSGTLTTMYSFGSSPTDGEYPLTGLVQASDGNFYGTTYEGGSSSDCGQIGCGTMFKITPGGILTIFYNFDWTSGATPYAGVIQATDGNLYGATSSGGANNGGTIFNITLDGTLTVLYNFCTPTNCGDGYGPQGGLFQRTDGIFYGTTDGGGVNFDDGTIYSLNMSLAPFVTFVRDSGSVGQTGGILGQGFTGTTSVSLNGLPVSFTVMSDTFIKATVPSGATTGYVTVTTPSGTLNSNVPFRVIP